MKAAGSSENHTLVHNKYYSLRNATYKIEVRGVTQGGVGPPETITFPCVRKTTTDKDSVDVGETTVTTFTLSTNFTFDETTVPAVTETNNMSSGESK